MLHSSSRSLLPILALALSPAAAMAQEATPETGEDAVAVSTADMDAMRLSAVEEIAAIIAAAEEAAMARLTEAEAAAEEILAGAEAAVGDRVAEAEAGAVEVLAAAESEAADMISAAEAEAEAILAEARARAEAEAETIVADAQAEADALLAEARAAAVTAVAEERARIAAEEEAARIAAEEEAARLAAEEAAALRAEGEAALARCIAIAGEPDARLPVSEGLLDAQIAAAAEAVPDCEAALDGLDDADAGAALYHLGLAAQTSGEHEAAVAYYERAAAAGVPEADSKLGDYYFLDIGRIGTDLDRAIGYYTAAAEAGEPEAIRTLALIYGQGRGVDRSARRMVELLGEAAALDYHFAQLILGRIYLSGEGVPAREQGRLGIPDADRGLELLQAASENGNEQAAVLLTELYSGAISGLQLDDAERFRWTEEAAATGLPEAINALGFLYERGIGTLPDPGRAALAYVQAIEAGLDIDDLRGTVDGTLPPWDEATAVAFQELLIARGVYNGPLDGLIGAGTIAGARALGGG